MWQKENCYSSLALRRGEPNIDGKIYFDTSQKGSK